MLAALISVSLLFPQLIDSTRTLKEPVPSATEITREKRADIFVARKMYREAIDSYQLAIKESPRDAQLYNKLGISYQRLEMFDQARRNYEESTRLNAKYSEAVNNLGTIFFAERRYRRAQQHYEKALQLNPSSASVYSNLGTALFARGRYKQAAAAYIKALELDPTVFDIKGTAGTTLQDRTVEERGRYYYYLAQAFADSGQFEQAVIYLRRSMEEGYVKAIRADQDPAFKALYEFPEFLAFVKPETAEVR